MHGQALEEDGLQLNLCEDCQSVAHCITGELPLCMQYQPALTNCEGGD